MARPSHDHAVDRGNGACRIGFAPKRLRNSHQLAATDVAHDNLLAVWRRFDDPHISVEQKEEGVRLLFLLEDGPVFRHA
jgi:hypothetical protein